MMRGRTAPLAFGLLALLCAAAAPAAKAPAGPAQPAPDWAADIADSFIGREWNAGEMQCARTRFTLQDGALVGHYWIGDREPFEGDLTGFVPGPDHSGRFTWTDRFGAGVMVFRFAPDGQSFYSVWGDNVPDSSRPGYGLRGEAAIVPGCNSPES